MQDPFEQYGPPFDLLSDMLFAFAFAPAEPLRGVFRSVPFLSLGGRVPLAMWFSRVKEGIYSDPGTGKRLRLGSPSAVLYYELNVVAALRRRGGFVPGIYATSPLTIAVGRRYGMPKQPTRMGLGIAGSAFYSVLDDHGRRSHVRARLLGNGLALGAVFSRLWPRWSWPAFFPDGRSIRAQIQATPHVHLAHITAGRLALNAPWLPRPVALLPLGIYLPNQRMRLPPPRDDARGA